MYFYRRWEYKRKNSIGRIKDYEKELVRGYDQGDIIEADSDEDDLKPPKYLH